MPNISINNIKNDTIQIKWDESDNFLYDIIILTRECNEGTNPWEGDSFTVTAQATETENKSGTKDLKFFKIPKAGNYCKVYALLLKNTLSNILNRPELDINGDTSIESNNISKQEFRLLKNNIEAMEVKNITKSGEFK